MMQSILKYLSAFFVLLLLAACGREGKTLCEEEGDTIQFKYAKNIQIIRYADHIQVDLTNPWNKEALLHSYCLVNDNDNHNLNKGNAISIPIKSAAVYSGVHCSLIDELGAIDRISAVCDLQYITDKKILKRCKDGLIEDFGNSMSPNIERIIQTSPDAILLSPFENSGGYGTIENLGIPLIECADYMESSPLARAEWIRFYGILFGKEREADSIFTEIETKYNELKAIVKKAKKQPKVICDLVTGSTWYVAGGRSTIGQLINDAGGDYIFKSDESEGSLALSPEMVFDKSQDADIWFIRYTQNTDKTYDELRLEFAPYAEMKAFKNHNIYGCNLQYVPFFEETPFHPEALLADFIKMLHPECLSDYESKYFKKL